MKGNAGSCSGCLREFGWFEVFMVDGKYMNHKVIPSDELRVIRDFVWF